MSPAVRDVAVHRRRFHHLRASGMTDDADYRRIIAKQRRDGDLCRLQRWWHSQAERRCAYRSLGVQAIERQLYAAEVGRARARGGDADVQRVSRSGCVRGRPGAGSASDTNGGAECNRGYVGNVAFDSHAMCVLDDPRCTDHLAHAHCRNV